MCKRKKRVLYFYKNSVLYERDASVMSRAKCLKTEENVEIHILANSRSLSFLKGRNDE